MIVRVSGGSLGAGEGVALVGAQGCQADTVQYREGIRDLDAVRVRGSIVRPIAGGDGTGDLFPGREGTAEGAVGADLGAVNGPTVGALVAVLVCVAESIDAAGQGVRHLGIRWGDAHAGDRGCGVGDGDGVGVCCAA